MEEGTMQSVQCPVCHNQVFSNSFPPGQRFPCPHCEYELEIGNYDETPVVRLSEDLDSQMNWARGIWKGGRLLMTSQKLAILGEMVVSALEMEAWAGETIEQLRERDRRLAEAQELLISNSHKPDLVEAGRLLLDIFINLRTAESSPNK